MKTIINSTTSNSLEIAKQILFSFQVLIIGLFIPFSFVFGITYKRHDEKAQKEISVRKSNPALLESGNTINFHSLPDQNS